eukprot:TRINITY_DN38976_c0_g1_i3.p2 TRINITY_DN38976_c0_g1~~TRINITY_DN38976_c0_g1_i3.p2  ORF type:complete len:214 (+),score=9.13 TRINITY_DN38976_c0_g1_i3:1-642(+)
MQLKLCITFKHNLFQQVGLHGWESKTNQLYINCVFNIQLCQSLYFFKFILTFLRRFSSLINYYLMIFVQKYSINRISTNLRYLVLQNTVRNRSVSALDSIFLKGMVFHGYHGVLNEEKVLGQKFVVDAELYCRLDKAGESDDLKDTIDYAAVYKDIRQVVEERQFQLQERVVSLIASELFKKYSMLQGVQLKIYKPHVALPGVLDGVGAKIVR